MKFKKRPANENDALYFWLEETTFGVTLKFGPPGDEDGLFLLSVYPGDKVMLHCGLTNDDIDLPIEHGHVLTEFDE